MATSSATPPVRSEELGPGRTVYSSGILHTTDHRLVIPTATAKVGPGVEQRVVVGYHDTSGNLVRFEEVDVPSGQWLNNVYEGDLMHVYAHRGGEGDVIFSVWHNNSDATPEEITVSHRGSLVVPAGVRHSARNDSGETVYVSVVAIRCGAVADRDRFKGRNVPRAQTGTTGR